MEARRVACELMPRGALPVKRLATRSAHSQMSINGLISSTMRVNHRVDVVWRAKIGDGGGAVANRLLTNLNLPRLSMARYMVEPAHRRQSFRRIHLFRRNRRRDRGGTACISGTVEEP